MINYVLSSKTLYAKFSEYEIKQVILPVLKLYARPLSDPGLFETA